VGRGESRSEVDYPTPRVEQNLIQDEVLKVKRAERAIVAQVDVIVKYVI